MSLFNLLGFLVVLPVAKREPVTNGPLTTPAAFQESSNGPVKKSMREKAIERRIINKEHNSNFKAGYVPIEEERLHKTGLRGRKGNIAVCVVVLLFLLALINLIVSPRPLSSHVPLTVLLSCLHIDSETLPSLR